MVKIQPCNKGCQKLILVQFDEQIGKYVPYEVDPSGNPTQRHNCPNSEYNKQQQSGGGGSFQKTSTFNSNPPPQQPQAIDKLSLEATLLNQVSQKLNSLVVGHNELVASLTEKLVTLDAIVRQNNIMLEAIVAHLKLTEPKKASELYQSQEQKDKAEKERIEISGWNSKEKEEGL